MALALVVTMAVALQRKATQNTLLGVGAETITKVIVNRLPGAKVIVNQLPGAKVIVNRLPGAKVIVNRLPEDVPVTKSL
jgi:hypothetical protein